MLRQWRVGMGGPVGFDYAALPVVEKRVGVKKRDRREVFEAIQVMEDEALRIMAKKNG